MAHFIAVKYFDTSCTQNCLLVDFRVLSVFFLGNWNQVQRVLTKEFNSFVLQFSIKHLHTECISRYIGCILQANRCIIAPWRLAGRKKIMLQTEKIRTVLEFLGSWLGTTYSEQGLNQEKPTRISLWAGINWPKIKFTKSHILYSTHRNFTYRRNVLTDATYLQTQRYQLAHKQDKDNCMTSLMSLNYGM